MKIIYINICIGIAVLFASCNKHSENDMSAPVLTITAPAANQVYATGANVIISGTVTDNSLHELVITITNTATSAVLYTKTISVHDLSSYSINESWVNNVTAITNATVKVEVEDHDSNHIEKMVQIILNP
jgi:hypothetical protein